MDGWSGEPFDINGATDITEILIEEDGEEIIVEVTMDDEITSFSNERLFAEVKQILQLDITSFLRDRHHYERKLANYVGSLKEVINNDTSKHEINHQIHNPLIYPFIDAKFIKYVDNKDPEASDEDTVYNFLLERDSILKNCSSSVASKRLDKLAIPYMTRSTNDIELSELDIDTDRVKNMASHAFTSRDMDCAAFLSSNDELEELEEHEENEEEYEEYEEKVTKTLKVQRTRVLKEENVPIKGLVFGDMRNKVNLFNIEKYIDHVASLKRKDQVYLCLNTKHAYVKKQMIQGSVTQVNDMYICVEVIRDKRDVMGKSMKSASLFKFNYKDLPSNNFFIYGQKWIDRSNPLYSASRKILSNSKMSWIFDVGSISTFHVDTLYLWFFPNNASTGQGGQFKSKTKNFKSSQGNKNTKAKRNSPNKDKTVKANTNTNTNTNNHNATISQNWSVIFSKTSNNNLLRFSKTNNSFSKFFEPFISSIFDCDMARFKHISTNRQLLQSYILDLWRNKPTLYSINESNQSNVSYMRSFKSNFPSKLRDDINANIKTSYMCATRSSCTIYKSDSLSKSFGFSIKYNEYVDKDEYFDVDELMNNAETFSQNKVSKNLKQKTGIDEGIESSNHEDFKLNMELLVGMEGKEDELGFVEAFINLIIKTLKIIVDPSDILKIYGKVLKNDRLENIQAQLKIKESTLIRKAKKQTASDIDQKKINDFIKNKLDLERKQMMSQFYGETLSLVVAFLIIYVQSSLPHTKRILKPATNDGNSDGCAESFSLMGFPLQSLAQPSNNSSIIRYTACVLNSSRAENIELACLYHGGIDELRDSFKSNINFIMEDRPHYRAHLDTVLNEVASSEVFDEKSNSWKVGFFPRIDNIPTKRDVIDMKTLVANVQNESIGSGTLFQRKAKSVSGSFDYGRLKDFGVFNPLYCVENDLNIASLESNSDDNWNSLSIFTSLYWMKLAQILGVTDSQKNTWNDIFVKQDKYNATSLFNSFGSCMKSLIPVFIGRAKNDFKIDTRQIDKKTFIGYEQRRSVIDNIVDSSSISLINLAKSNQGVLDHLTWVCSIALNGNIDNVKDSSSIHKSVLLRNYVILKLLFSLVTKSRTQPFDILENHQPNELLSLVKVMVFKICEHVNMNCVNLDKLNLDYEKQREGSKQDQMRNMEQYGRDERQAIRHLKERVPGAMRFIS